MLTIKEVALRLKVTDRTVRRWIDEGKLKALKIGGAIRITEEAYSDFINLKAG
jgi:excisionase family DNA binding protein